MKYFNKIRLLLLSLIIVQVSFAQDPNFHIYLSFGQSNMEGQGTIEAQDRNVDSRFRIMQAVNCTGQPQGAWRTANPSLARCNTGLGPTDNFGRTMVANTPDNITIGVVVVAVAGCKIELFDKTNYATYVNTTEEWMRNIINEYGGNPYGRLVELARLAQQDGVIKGILMHQGESNTGETTWPGKVKGVYDNLLADLGLNAADVPLLVGEVVGADQNGQCASHNNIIANVPNTIPTAHVISSYGCTEGGDRLHFSSAGYRLLGERYAEKMLTLISFEEETMEVNITSPSNNQQFDFPSDITFQATASASEGSVVAVEYYNGETLLGRVTTDPYRYVWENAPAGTHQIRAVAINSNTNTVTTNITIKVTAPSLMGEISVRANGAVGDEIIELEIDGEIIETWTLGTTYQTFSATGNVNGTIRINYTNDDGADRDAFIDYIVVAGVTYEAEDQAINTGYYANGECGGGSHSETMHCSGYIEFETQAVLEIDLCPNDPNKTEPGLCGCGVPEGTCEPEEGIELYAGWNIIGFPHTESLPIQEALSSIWENVEGVKDLELFYESTYPENLNQLIELDFGKGYFIRVSTNCTLVW